MSRKKTTPVAVHWFALENVRKPCAAIGCTRSRIHTNKYCATHRNKHALWGHSEGGALNRRLVKKWRGIVRAFLHRYQNTVQVQASVKFMSALLEGRLTGSSPPAAQHLRRVVGDGLTPLEALEIVTAVWMISIREPRTLPDDARLDYALGFEICRSRQHGVERYYSNTNGDYRLRSARPSGAARRAIGRLIRSHLGLTFMQMSRRMEADHEAKLSQRAALTAPFEPVAAPPPTTP